MRNEKESDVISRARNSSRKNKGKLVLVMSDDSKKEAFCYEKGELTEYSMIEKSDGRS